MVGTGRTEVRPPRSVQNLLDLRWQRNSQCWGLYHVYSIQIDNKNNCTKTLLTPRYKAALSWWPLPQGRWFQQPSPCTLDSHQTQKTRTAQLPQRCRSHCSGNGSAEEGINRSAEQQILHISQSINQSAHLLLILHISQSISPFITYSSHQSISPFVSKCSLYVFTIIPPQLTDPYNFITALLVTQEPEQTTLLFWSDAFVLKRCVLRNATWPSHTRPAIAAGARHFQICFLP